MHSNKTAPRTENLLIRRVKCKLLSLPVSQSCLEPGLEADNTAELLAERDNRIRELEETVRLLRQKLRIEPIEESGELELAGQEVLEQGQRQQEEDEDNQQEEDNQNDFDEDLKNNHD